MLSQKEYLNIIYELTELSEKRSFNYRDYKFNRFVSLNIICNKIIEKHNIVMSMKNLLKAYNNLWYKGFLEKKSIIGFTTLYSLKKYKNYTIQDNFFKLLNKRYSLKNKNYFFNVV